MPKDEEKPFRLRPRKPAKPHNQNEPAAWAIAFKTVIQYARESRRHARANASHAGQFASRTRRSQRCAIRITYTRNAVRGQWRAHGRYIQRESAADPAGASGFDRDAGGIEIAERLQSWQAARDVRLWKIILSPEFGDRLDLTRLTRDLMGRMERELETTLEWVAVPHFNTEHPHVHIALRGVGRGREPLRFDRDFLKHGVRSIAEDLCTRQLGYRTEVDAAEAERREIGQKRFTSLDRMILRKAERTSEGPASFLTLRIPEPNGSPAGPGSQRYQHMAARLAVLEHMGLAHRVGASTWALSPDFESVLRAMQRAADRQRVLAAHGVVLSDERLPIEVLDTRKATSVEGRVLVHGEDEESGRNYLMLEGTDARVYHVGYTPEIDEARARGEMQPGSFVRLRRASDEGSDLQIEDLGDAEALVSNPDRLSTTAAALLTKGIVPREDDWGGWLGRYQAALRQAATGLSYSKMPVPRNRSRGRSLGR
jgi:type IV secretory pathway VirD2 relaxase